MDQPHLVLFDADHIKGYVFATGVLKEIRGASEMVRRLTDEHRLLKHAAFAEFGLTTWQEPGSARIIYAAGGAGAIRFEDGANAHRFCRELEHLYWRQTRSATLSAIAEPIPNGDEVSAQRRAAGSLARRKASKPLVRDLPGGGLLRFGASDRLHAAEVQLHDADGALLLISEETARKRKLSFEYRSELPRLPFWHQFLHALPPERLERWDDPLSESQDLGSIGEQARPRDYVAFIHLDGDSVGATLRDVVSKHGFPGYHSFSQALNKAAQEATAIALAQAYRDHTPPRRPPRRGQGDPMIELPFELITIGGDDVMLICTAEQGLAIAATLSEQFGQRVAAYLGPLAPATPISASVGVVIAHSSMPIVQLQERAYDLLKNAKRQRDPVRDAGLGMLDFQIVTTPALDHIKTLRQQGYQGDDRAELTRRPYRRDQAQLLLDHAQQLRRMPEFSTSKHADLYAACAQNRTQATLDVLQVCLRLRGDERMALLHALKALDSVKYFPFTRELVGSQWRFRTALLDLLEVMEFVPAPMEAP